MAGNNRVIVLHPGSHTLKLGFSSVRDDPFTCPHVVRFRKSKGGNDLLEGLDSGPEKARNGDDASADAQNIKKRKLEQESQATPTITPIAALKGIQKELVAARRKAKHVPVPPPKELRVYTDRNGVVTRPADEDSFQWTDTSNSPDCLVGWDALHLSPDNDEYDRLIRPFQSGFLNISAHFSREAAASSLEAIWSHAIATLLGVKRDQHDMFEVVLVVNDHVEGGDTKLMIDVVLRRMGFSAVLVCQESICAAFGTGLTTACVVDVGHEKVSIACIEDGFCIPSSRVHLGYGGLDVDRCLLWLLRNSGRHWFPSKQVASLHCPQVASAVSTLKEKQCHMNPLNTVMQECSFSIRSSAAPTVTTYSVNASDALSVAPMGLLHPEVFQAYRQTPLPSATYPYGDLEDLKNKAWLTEMKLAAEAVKLGQPLPGPLGAKCPSTMVTTYDSIDVAIHRSIEPLLYRPELAQRLYSSIVFVGGSSVLDNLLPLVEARVTEKAPFVVDPAQVAVTTNTKLFDARFVSWCGGCVVSSLESSKDMWIDLDEWNQSGISTLRERNMFHI